MSIPPSAGSPTLDEVARVASVDDGHPVQILVPPTLVRRESA